MFSAFGCSQISKTYFLFHFEVYVLFLLMNILVSFRFLPLLPDCLTLFLALAWAAKPRIQVSTNSVSSKQLKHPISDAIFANTVFSTTWILGQDFNHRCYNWCWPQMLVTLPIWLLRFKVFRDLWSFRWFSFFCQQESN